MKKVMITGIGMLCASGNGKDEVWANIKAGKSYVMRLRSPGKPGGRIKYKDVIKGNIEMRSAK